MNSLTKRNFSLASVRPAAPSRPPRRQVIVAYREQDVKAMGTDQVNWANVTEKTDKLPVHFTQGQHAVSYHHDPDGKSGYPFYNPPIALLGVGALNAAGEEIKKLCIKRPLVVTDGVLFSSGAIKPVHEMLVRIGLQKHSVFSGVAANPTVEQCFQGLEVLQRDRCDAIISFGGGSPHDCAKAIAAMATNGGVSPQEFEGVNRVPNKTLPLIAINTTAGTAAEMTRFSIITDTKRKVKMALIDDKLTPSLAVNDPTVMLGMPKGLTAATGMDALTHAIEAYLSTASSPVTDACALHAIRLITSYLRTAVTDGRDMKARDMMAYAEYLAGMAFNSAGLGYVHACAHQLGGYYNLAHGVCNAILLPTVCEFNAKVVPELFIDIATAMGLRLEEDCPPEKAVQMVLQEIRRLARDVGIPKLRDFPEVRPQDFPVLAEHAMEDACGSTNPRRPTKEEVIGLFKKAYEEQ